MRPIHASQDQKLACSRSRLQAETMLGLFSAGPSQQVREMGTGKNEAGRSGDFLLAKEILD